MMTHSVEPPHGLKKYLPLLQWLPVYPSKWLRLDLVAGLTTAAVVIPQSMAYATIAGLPVEVGLYTPLVLMVVYALLGTSRVLMVSTTSTISLLTAATLSMVVPKGDSDQYLTAATTLAFLVGVFLILAGLLRLGVLANLISLPVLTGFKAGIGVVIFVGQIPKVLGISIEDGSFLQDIFAILRGLNDIHWMTFAVALLMLVILIFLPRVNSKIPASLVAVVLGILASALLNLEAQGVELVGDIPSRLPSLRWPDMALLSQLWPGALGIALMAFIESIAAGRSFALKVEPKIEANQELIALGAANLAGSLLQAYPGGGGTSITAVNRKAGAKTQISGLVISAMVALTVLVLARFVSFMPEATLGALVMVAAVGLIGLKDFRAMLRVRSTEFVWAIVAFLGVVLLGTLQGILIAVIVSILTLIYQASFPPVYALRRKPGTDVFRPVSPEHPKDETIPGLLMIRTEGRLNFMSAPSTSEKGWDLIHRSHPRVLVLEFSGIPDLEYTALNMLTKFEEELRAEGITLWLAALNPEPLKVIRHSSLGKIMWDERMFFNLEQAVEAYLALELERK